MIFLFFSSRRRHTRLQGDWSSDVCSSDLDLDGALATTEFTSNGVTHVRQVFASKPDNVLVIRLSASKPGNIDADVTFHPPRSEERRVGKKCRWIGWQ